MSPDDTGRTGRSGEFRDLDGRSLPERIRQRRTARGLKSFELAEALKISPSYVTMIERGKKIPSEDMAVAIAELLGDDPELYRAWVHSTRFTDPTSTLRGLTRLRYSGPQQLPPSSNARIQSASLRANRLARFRRPPSGEDSPARAHQEMALRSAGEVHDLPAELPGPALRPLLSLGQSRDDRLVFWRLPWALLDNDRRPRRFVVASTPDPDILLVAAPRQFAAAVLGGPDGDALRSDAWRGWDARGRRTDDGGACDYPWLPGGPFRNLLRDRGEFVQSLGAAVDVIVHEGSTLSIRQVTPAELNALLGPGG